MCVCLDPAWKVARLPRLISLDDLHRDKFRAAERDSEPLWRLRLLVRRAITWPHFHAVARVRQNL